MNNNQRKLFIVIGIILLIMLAFPPFKSTVKGTVFNSGYAFIFIGPSSELNVPCVDAALLFIQWLFVVSIGFIGWHLLKNKQ